MARLRVTRVSIGVVCLFLLNPLTFRVERYSWNDPLVLLPLCATLYAAVKRRWWLPLALGLFFASKQYAVLGIPFVVLLDSNWKRSLKLLGQALGVSVAVTAPFALWNIRHFFQDKVLFQLHGPFREDSLTFSVLFPVPLSVICIAVAGATAWALIVAKRHPSMFAACYGFVLLIFVCANKQAHPNYYFLIAQSIWLAVAASGVPVNSPRQETSQARPQAEPVIC